MTMTVTTRAGAAAAPAPADGEAAALPKRSIPAALVRGARGRCPACGGGRLFSSYLKVAPYCPACGEALYHQRADDAPPYAVIFVVGHIVVPLMVIVEEVFRPEIWVHLALWLPLTLILSLALLPPLKGMLVALQWALRMHGFDPASPEREDPPALILAPAARPTPGP